MNVPRKFLELPAPIFNLHEVFLEFYSLYEHEIPNVAVTNPIRCQ
jgi:hypothetical protein